MMRTRTLLVFFIAVMVSACATKTEVIRADFTQREGVYVVAFTPNNDIRARVEDELVANLRAEGAIAHPSYPDISDIVAGGRDAVLAAANGKKLIGVLVLNQAAADASDSVVADPNRVSPLHADLQAFYAHANASQSVPGEQSQRGFFEINLFVIDDNKANLFWSGTAWSDHADGQGGAITEISQLVTQQLIVVRDRLRN